MLYDLITIGGGLAGAALARALAERGRRVVIVEREAHFRDRVRGEYLEAWGVAEARRLGLGDTLLRAGAHEVPWTSDWIGGVPMLRKDVRQANPERLAPLCLSHPAMQEAVLAAAREAGAEVLRPATAVDVEPGPELAVEVRRNDGSSARFNARLVVGADGRESKARGWGGFAVERDAEKLAIAGLLLDGFTGPDDVGYFFWNFAAGEQALLFPQGAKRVRAYVVFHANGNLGRLSGRQQIPDFLAVCEAAKVPAEWLEGAVAAGPLAAFQGADAYVPHPARNGIALVGDAAASSDPTWGCGLSLTLRDVRVLRDALLASDDWSAALQAYGEQHDRYYGRLHTLERWLSEAFFDVGPEADLRRERIFARAATEPDRIPDLAAHGPDQPCDEAARRRLFAED